jgi:peroxiredoxin
MGVASELGAGKLEELVEAYGIQSFSSATPAIDFRLPALDGGEVSLSDFQGDWVILTFWASWCGPCKSEMPSLEALHRDRGDAGLAVIGVSLDNDLEAARTFVNDMDLTFPLLWDDTGGVGRDYRASAIPMSYLIDPTGGIVGVATGARDWKRIVPLVDALKSGSGETGSIDAVYADSGAVGLPQVIDPPTAEMVLSNNEPRVGQEFELEIRLRWAGRLEKYLPQAPKVHLPEGVRQSRVRASTHSRDGSEIVTYRLLLSAEKAGSYALDPVELRYTPRLATSAVTTRLIGPTVVVQPRTLGGVRPGVLALGAGGLIITAVFGVAVGRRWRSAKSQADEPSEPTFEALEAELTHAKTLRMQGDGRSCVLALVVLARKIESDGGLGEGGLDALEESVRYGGSVPPNELKDRLQRVIERRLDSLEPDPHESARMALRLSGKASYSE